MGAGLRGRACCDGRMNLHANTTAMANPATAPSDPALWENKSGATHSHTHTESQSVRVRALGGGGGGSPAGSRGMLGEGNPPTGFTLLYLVVEEQRDDVGDPAVEGAGDAAHQRDGGVLLRGEARHCERGGGERGGVGLPSLISPCGIGGEGRRGQVGVGEVDCLAGSGRPIGGKEKGSRRPREETNEGGAGAGAGATQWVAGQGDGERTGAYLLCLSGEVVARQSDLK